MSARGEAGKGGKNRPKKRDLKGALGRPGEKFQSMRLQKEWGGGKNRGYEEKLGPT